MADGKRKAAAGTDAQPDITTGSAPELPVESASDPPAEAAELEPELTLEALLEAARVEADQQRGAADLYRDMLKRVQADFVNYKHRIESEQAARTEAIRAETLRAFLPVVDDLERALEHVPEASADQSWAQGFGLIRRNLEALFERLGLERLGVEGEEFDPNVHEAVAYEEHPTQPEGHVSSVVRPGYRLGDRIVRPAQVSVARAAGPAGGWEEHEGRPGRSNGEAEQADLEKPRQIKRA